MDTTEAGLLQVLENLKKHKHKTPCKNLGHSQIEQKSVASLNINKWIIYIFAYLQILIHVNLFCQNLLN